jgi:sulfite exporter TauE/SafE/plastocyanin domain-containing protein/copper chaperone CopZ
MHCRSCELLIEDHLKELANVHKVEVNHSTGEAIVHYKGERPSDEVLHAAILKAGYQVGQEEVKPLLNLDSNNLFEIISGIGILFFLYIILKSFGLTDINLSPDISEPSFGLVLLVGLVAGVSTCMALIGGLILGVSSKFVEQHPHATRKERFRPHLFLVGGRILGYAFFGGILGLLGSVFQLSSTMNATLTLLVGALMLFIGLQLTNLFPRLTNFSFSLPPSIAKLFGINKKQREYSHKHAAILGALTFFLPCGFTQAMQVYAVSRGNFLDGAMIMGLFALGTAPGLLGVGGITATVKSSFRSLFFKTAGVAIVALSLFNINNGYSLLAANFDFSSPAGSQDSTGITDPNVTLEDGVQVVRMAETNAGYTPNQFTIKKGVPVKWIVDAQAPYSCASVLGIPKLRIQKFLKAGENVIEFTPTEAGALKFSCSMGMYTGVFNVVDGDSAATKTSDSQVAGDQSASDIPAPVVSGGTCGSGGGGCGCGGGARPSGAVKTPAAAAQQAVASDAGDVQVIKATYTSSDWVQPNAFKVKAGQKVRMEIDVKDSGSGCGNAITIPDLADSVEPLVAGSPIVFEFTPTTPGTFDITCGMNMIRFGSITVE